MKLNVYAVLDSKLAAFMTPFFCVNNAVACRMISGACNSGDSILSVSPSDFNLYSVGSFDSDSGLLTSLDAPVFVQSVLNLVGSDVPDPGGPVQSVLNLVGSDVPDPGGPENE